MTVLLQHVSQIPREVILLGIKNAPRYEVISFMKNIKRFLHDACLFYGPDGRQEHKLIFKFLEQGEASVHPTRSLESFLSFVC
jgi:hypothetical protein